MKKILVTGAGGFIGSHLCEFLVKEGFSVRAFVKYSSDGRRGWLDASSVKDQIEFVSGDIRDFDLVSESMKGVNQVFHLAALIGIPYSYLSPLAYIRTNIEGTYNILEAAKKNQTQKIVCTSTSEVYGSALRVPIDESHPLQPQSPYSASKISADQMALSYFNSFSLPVVLARPFNTFGPRQSARAVIPTLLAQVANDQKKIKIGNLNPRRDFTYVEDTVRGIFKLSQSEKLVGMPVNIGTGSSLSIRELAEKIAKLFDCEIELAEDSQRLRPEKSEVMNLVCDATRLASATDWTPSTPLDQGLKLTKSWIDQNLKLYRPQEYNV